MGLPGPDGSDGLPGAPGGDGATWLTGPGIPVDTIGADTDLFLDTLSGDVYRKESGIWVFTANIEGPVGPTGPSGPQGPSTGPAGGDLEGFYPNPTIKDTKVVKSLRGLEGSITLSEGHGINITSSGQTITIENKGLPVVRTWPFNIYDLGPIQLGSGGLGYISGADLDVDTPVYLFNHLTVGNTITSGVTTIPDFRERDFGLIDMELYWVTSKDGGNVRWRVTYSARTVGNLLNNDDEIMVTTPVDKTGADRIYKTLITLDDGLSTSDQILVFTLTRQSSLDTNSGNVGLLGIRFSYVPEGN
jgi:hypothetical protein